jgi:hypothetical protein
MKTHNIEENKSLPKKYKKANDKFKSMMKNKPDFSKMEPIEIYNWFNTIYKLTKI